jgi:hypothetical protein
MQPVLFSNEFSARINSLQSFKILRLEAQILGSLHFIHKNKKKFFAFLEQV